MADPADGSGGRAPAPSDPPAKRPDLGSELQRAAAGFVDHVRPLDPWNEVTPPEISGAEESVYLDVADEISVVPVESLEEAPHEPIDPFAMVSPLPDPYAGDGPFAVALDGPGSDWAARVPEPAPRPAPKPEVRPAPSRPPRAVSIRSDLATQFQQPIMVQRRVGPTASPEPEITESEVAVAPPLPPAATIGALRASSLATPAASPPGILRQPPTPAPTGHAVVDGTPSRRPAGRAFSQGSSPGTQGQGERRYPKMRALLKNPDLVPYGSGPRERKKAPPVPGTFFPTPRRERERTEAEAPPNLDEMLATMAEGLLIGESPTGGTEVRVTLRDEFFAGTELRIIAGEGRVRAVLVPPDRSTYLTLNGNIDELRARLEARGLAIEELRVADP